MVNRCFSFLAASVMSASAMLLGMSAYAAPVEICNNEASKAWVDGIAAKLAGPFTPRPYFGAIRPASAFSPQLRPSDDTRALWISSILNGHYTRTKEGIVDELDGGGFLSATIAYVRDSTFSALSTTDAERIQKLRENLFAPGGAMLPDYAKYAEAKKSLREAEDKLKNEPGNATLAERVAALKTAVAQLLLSKGFDKIEDDIRVLELKDPQVWREEVLSGLDTAGIDITLDRITATTKRPSLLAGSRELDAISYFNVTEEVSFAKCAAGASLGNGRLSMSLAAVPFEFAANTQSILGIIRSNSIPTDAGVCGTVEGSLSTCFGVTAGGSSSQWVLPMGLLVAKDILVSARDPFEGHALRMLLLQGAAPTLARVDLSHNSWTVASDDRDAVVVERPATYIAQGETNLFLPGYVVLGLYFGGYQPR